MLMQGLELPNPSPCSLHQLPPTINRPSSPPSPPVEPFVFEEPEDTYGQAHVRTVATGSTASTVVISASTTDSTTAIESVISTTTGSRTITTTSSNSNQLTPIAEDVPAPQQIVTVATREVSRTTQWRRARKRKQQLLEGTTPPVEEKRPREYKCSTCHQPMAGNLK